MKIKSTGAVCSIPHGLVLWSTGVGTRPAIKDFMEQIGQVGCRIPHACNVFEFEIYILTIIFPTLAYYNARDPKFQSQLESH